MLYDLSSDLSSMLQFAYGYCTPKASRGEGVEGSPLCGLCNMCGSKGYGFLAILVKNRVSILAILVSNAVVMAR